MDQIYKLQSHRTMSLQGFDDYGAAAALWGASDTGFTLSGVFRDLADFAVRPDDGVIKRRARNAIGLRELI